MNDFLHHVSANKIAYIYTSGQTFGTIMIFFLYLLTKGEFI